MSIKKIFISIIVSLVVIASFGVSSSAHSVKIKGPSTVTVKAGVVKKVKYYIYADGIRVSDDVDIYGLEMYSTAPDVDKTTKYIDAFYDPEHPNNFYFLAQKAKTQTVVLTTQVSIDGRLKKVKKKVKVKVKKNNAICLGGWVYGYSTRNNIFSVSITNYSSKPITILPTGAHALNKEYKIFDRELYIQNSQGVTIPAGEKKKVQFKFNGNSTWYDFEDFIIKCKASFNGKVYDLRIFPCESLDGYGGKVQVKINGKWKKTLKEKILPVD